MAKQKDTVEEVVKAFDEAKNRYHDVWTKKVENLYDAWRGVPPSNSKAKQWQSQVFPPYVFPIVQTMVASIVDDRIRFTVEPRPRMDDQEELERYANGARALELLLAYQLDVDSFDEKQPEYVQQMIIAGLTVGKTYWKYDAEKYMGEVRRQEFDPYLGITVDSIAEEEKTRVLVDDPCFEVVQVRDFFWHEAARDLQSAKWVVHRVWKTYEELERIGRLGIYDNVSKLKDSRSSSDNSWELTHGGRERTRDMIEVLEYWKRDADGVKTCTVGARNVLLQPMRPSPFDHGEYPFVTCSSQPDLFQIPGVPEVELIAPLQATLWDMGNQQMDNLRLVANTVFAINEGYVDWDDLASKFAPGEAFPIENIDGIKQLTFDPTPAKVMQEQIATYKGELQNATQGMPFLSGSQSQTIDQQTATGVSIVTSLAQRAVQFKKQLVAWSYERMLCQHISNNQQFLDGPRAVPYIGEDGVQAFREIFPEDISGGKYSVEWRAMSESLMRQERRAEEQAKLTVALQAAPICAAVGIPLNMKAFVEDFLRAYDIDDLERYFSAQPQAQAAAGSPGQSGVAQPGQENGGAGVTSPLAFGPQSPSSEGTPSMSPETFMQQALASSGGSNNA